MEEKDNEIQKNERNIAEKIAAMQASLSPKDGVSIQKKSAVLGKASYDVIDSKGTNTGVKVENDGKIDVNGENSTGVKNTLEGGGKLTPSSSENSSVKEKAITEVQNSNLNDKEKGELIGRINGENLAENPESLQGYSDKVRNMVQQQEAKQEDRETPKEPNEMEIVLRKLSGMPPPKGKEETPKLVTQTTLTAAAVAAHQATQTMVRNN